MLYKNKTIEELDSYYGIRSQDSYKVDDCKRIQEAFKVKGVNLTLFECRELYETYSDEKWCAQWENGISLMNLTEIFDLLCPILVGVFNDRIGRMNKLGGELIENGYVNLSEETN